MYRGLKIKKGIGFAAYPPVLHSTLNNKKD